MSAQFTLTVKSGVEYQPMGGLSSYDLSHRIDTLRAWFGPDVEFKIEADADQSNGSES